MRYRFKNSHSYLSNQWIKIELSVYKSALNISIVLKTPAVMLELIGNGQEMFWQAAIVFRLPLLCEVKGQAMKHM